MKIAVSIVLYKTDPQEFADLLNSLGKQQCAKQLDIFFLDNSPAEFQATIEGWTSDYTTLFNSIHYQASADNLGFGRGHNVNFRKSRDYDYVLILNQDIIVLDGSFDYLLATAENDTPEIGVWEMRQIPYEHPKIYNPVTLETGWVAGAACLFRQHVINEINGFDEDIFMYAEDVDISWRLVAAGYRCKYMPQSPVIHNTYSVPHENKPTLIFEGTLTHLLLRARYGSVFSAVQSFFNLLYEIIIPQAFAGRRKALVKLIPRYFKNVGKFRKSGQELRKTFTPTFYKWDYSLRRDGAFFPFNPLDEWADKPLVSIIIRTKGRPNALREALQTVANQTYPNIEAVVIEDDANHSQAVIDEFADKLQIKYQALGENQGRSKAGNAGLALASGEWFNFLDDDDQLFADHVEVLLKTVLENNLKGAYALAWEVPTEFTDVENWQYVEKAYAPILNQKFSRIILWYRNYLPIQAVLFHRSLYEKHGGFAEDLDYLEDWDLWVRYTLFDDLQMVEKTTSKYRVPITGPLEKERLDEIEARQKLAMAKQADLQKLSLSVAEIKDMVDEYHNTELFLKLSRSGLKRRLLRTRFGRYLYRKRPAIRRFVSKFRLRR